jgi:hypothetical protein
MPLARSEAVSQIDPVAVAKALPLITAGLAALAAAWRWLLRPIVDAFIVAALMRRRPDVVDWLRDEDVLGRHLAKSAQASADASEALAIARSMSSTLDLVARQTADCNTGVSQLTRLLTDHIASSPNR